MIIVASTTSYLIIVHPNVRIIPKSRARDIRLHVRVASRRFPMRNVHQAARQRLGEHHRDDHRLHRRGDFEWSTKQDCRPVRRFTLHAAKLAAGDGISMVDLFRHHRHVFRGYWVLMTGREHHATRKKGVMNLSRRTAQRRGGRGYRERNY